ncbi:gp39.1 hypothetical protein [Escherichia phage JS98]|uniref:Lipoprotein n=3 Tax=Caudoviricetes TaxID=2731619 RepID=A0A858I5A8_9CAUD|nr:gp39.1 hypothetical protein [Escherichia phage JS98]QBP35618.1 hypothetical protein [Phage NC-G]QIN95969.1 hypothetical protein MN04_00180 [Escherichia phage MN04]CAI9866039.1 hypothetical protein PFGHJN_00281 [Escherichia phage UP19]BBI57354.1 hypothetical protein KIT01_006 [Escherichia phage KIT01]ABX11030.1 gp39.1 hypothetical protein [Escherichia phage JS98]
MKYVNRSIAALVLAVSLVGCTDADNATRVLDANGYEQIQITGYNLFGCSEDDFQRTGFIAVGPTGKRVEGTVCSGLFFKKSTIRFD